MNRVLLLWIFVGAVAAQLDFAAQLPSCALNCIVETLPSTNCSLLDLECMCAADALWTQVSVCVHSTCDTREALTSERVANKACGSPVRDRSLSVAVVGPVLAGVSGIFVILRLLARRRSSINKASFGLGWDDFVLVAAWAFGVPKAIMDPFFRQYGLGRDVWTVPFNDIDNLLRLFYFGELFYLLSVSLTKIALLAFFLRVFPSRTSQRITWGMIALVLAFTIAFVFPLIFQCKPINYAWLRWDAEREGKCINVFAAFVSHGAVNMTLDFLILLLPIPHLYKLQINYTRQRKAQIAIMFSFGAITTVFSIIRLDALLVFEGSGNPSWDYWGAALWSVVEMYVGVICACLPAAKVFFARLLPGLLASMPTRDATDLRSNGLQKATFSDTALNSIGSLDTVKAQSPKSVYYWSKPLPPLEGEWAAGSGGDERAVSPMKHVAKVSMV